MIYFIQFNFNNIIQFWSHSGKSSYLSSSVKSKHWYTYFIGRANKTWRVLWYSEKYSIQKSRIISHGILSTENRFETMRQCPLKWTLVNTIKTHKIPDWVLSVNISNGAVPFEKNNCQRCYMLAEFSGFT